MYVTNWRKTTGTKEKSDIISQLEKAEQTVDDINCNVRLAHISMHTIRDNADTISRSARSVRKKKVFV
jgi:t-SNARE complex subunit (syntaxin)